MPSGNAYRAKALFLLAPLFMFSGCLESTKPPNPDLAGGSGNAGGSNSNQAPTISGSPDLAIMTGDTYAFTPVARDADGDPLTFSIQNKPGWASFSSTTGRLSGQTSLGHTGVYDNIRISVSDGKTTASLSAFSITVTQVALGSMTLSWTAPVENTDGTALMDLAGFKIYFGRSPGSYSNQIRIDNPSVDTYLVENLLPDTYYVVATSFNAFGVESQFSNVAIKIVTSN